MSNVCGGNVQSTVCISVPQQTLTTTNGRRGCKQKKQNPRGAVSSSTSFEFFLQLTKPRNPLPFPPLVFHMFVYLSTHSALCSLHHTMPALSEGNTATYPYDTQVPLPHSHKAITTHRPKPSPSTSLLTVSFRKVLCTPSRFPSRA